MDERQQQVIDELRGEGYAVVIFNPEELAEVNKGKVEDRLVELGWDVISDLS